MKKIPNKVLRIIFDNKFYGSKVCENTFFAAIMENISSALYFDNFSFEILENNTFATSHDSWKFLYEK